MGALDALGAVPGVLGAFLARGNELEASTLPLIFSSDSLGEASAPLQEVLRMIGQSGGPVEEVSISFGDARVVGAPLKSGELLLVVCQSNIDSAALKRLQDVLRQLRASPELELPGSGGDRMGQPEPTVTSATRVTGGPPHGLLGSVKSTSQSVLSAGTDLLTTIPGLQVRSTRGDELEQRAGSIQSSLAPAAGITGSVSSSTDSANSPTAVNPRSTGRSLRAGPLISPENRGRLVHELARFVGPVAQMLVDEQLQSAQQLAQGIERLSREIESLEDREEFLSRVASLGT